MRFRKGQHGFGILDLMVLLAIIVSLSLLLPIMARKKGRSAKINCTTNVKQAALGLGVWSNDHAEQFPWDVSTNDGGTREFVGTGKVFMHFQSVSNELNTPKRLVCPEDSKRSNVLVFDLITNSNVSYFVGINAHEGDLRLLTGDRSISTNSTLRSGRLEIPTPSDLKWSTALHPWGGNIATADGAAYQVGQSSTNLRSLAFPAVLEIP